MSRIISKQDKVPNPEMGTLYECPFNYTAEISSITITNGSANYIIEVRKALNSLTEGILLFKFDLDVGDKHINTEKVNLKSGDKILGMSNQNTTEYIIEGTETEITP